MAKKFEPRTYKVPADHLYSALMSAVGELKYKVKEQDPAARSVVFNTGLSIWSWSGQDMAVEVRPLGDDTSQLDLEGTLALKIQATSWGEKKRIAKKLYAKLDSAVGAPIDAQEL